MVKCVVSGCRNRLLNGNRGVLNRPLKRFFPFPKDPARVKVWLAALRETDKQEAAEQHLICEEHFLPEDISRNGVNSDAIPIMPPYLDGPLGGIGAWTVDSSEEDDQWGTPGGEEEEEEEGEEEMEEEMDGGDSVAPVRPPSPQPPQQVPSEPVRVPPQVKSPSVDLQSKEDLQTEEPHVAAVLPNVLPEEPLVTLTRRLLELLLLSPDNWLDLHQAANRLQTRKGQVYDIIGVLEGLSVVQRISSRAKWIGQCPISHFMWKTVPEFKKELESLKMEESTLDSFIKNCAQQLFDMTDNEENARAAYITHEDVSRLAAFKEQTVIVINAPEDTKLEVPTPTQDNIKMHMKGGKGPIAVMTCDLGTGGVPVKEEMSGCFMTLEESRIQTQTLHTHKTSR
ncbi:transcription factor E2F6 [Syngnathoides biaculeatus]|uniref:transcription factor E2F6 n=1 Tax=Syngnathoides biaculeatus TaxID=300417 RepID=UPI002ADE2B77|nr:transcription factor E2F6 [Syngnathoides biaculeatus]